MLHRVGQPREGRAGEPGADLRAGRQVVDPARRPVLRTLRRAALEGRPRRLLHDGLGHPGLLGHAGAEERGRRHVGGQGRHRLHRRRPLQGFGGRTQQLHRTPVGGPHGQRLVPLEGPQQGDLIGEPQHAGRGSAGRDLGAGRQVILAARGLEGRACRRTSARSAGARTLAEASPHGAVERALRHRRPSLRDLRPRGGQQHGRGDVAGQGRAGPGLAGERRRRGDQHLVRRTGRRLDLGDRLRLVGLDWLFRLVGRDDRLRLLGRDGLRVFLGLVLVHHRLLPDGPDDLQLQPVGLVRGIVGLDPGVLLVGLLGLLGLLGRGRSGDPGAGGRDLLEPCHVVDVVQLGRLRPVRLSRLPVRFSGLPVSLFRLPGVGRGGFLALRRPGHLGLVGRLLVDTVAEQALPSTPQGGAEAAVLRIGLREPGATGSLLGGAVPGRTGAVSVALPVLPVLRVAFPLPVQELEGLPRLPLLLQASDLLQVRGAAHQPGHQIGEVVHGPVHLAGLPHTRQVAIHLLPGVGHQARRLVQPGQLAVGVHLVRRDPQDLPAQGDGRRIQPVVRVLVDGQQVVVDGLGGVVELQVQVADAVVEAHLERGGGILLRLRDGAPVQLDGLDEVLALLGPTGLLLERIELAHLDVRRAERVRLGGREETGTWRARGAAGTEGMAGADPAARGRGLPLTGLLLGERAERPPVDPSTNAPPYRASSMAPGAAQKMYRVSICLISCYP